jgi:hypothetical protein
VAYQDSHLSRSALIRVILKGAWGEGQLNEICS